MNDGALYRLIWSRKAAAPTINPGYEYIIIHGHDYKQADTTQSVSLDSDLAREGKSTIITAGILPSRRSSSNLPCLENPEYYFANQKEFDLEYNRAPPIEDADDKQSSRNDELDSEEDSDSDDGDDSYNRI